MTLNARQISTPDFAARRRFVRIAPQSESHPAPFSSPIVSPVRVLIAGDHPTLRSCLKTMLELDPQISVVGEAADDCELVKMAHRVRPDVILIDIDRRCCDSFDAVAEIMQSRLASSVVALTIHDDAEERAEAQRAGVGLFLEKGVPYKQLISAVRLAALNSSQR
jgi:two-component system, NarL family, nitrate/nitrite response regulator NarL